MCRHRHLRHRRRNYYLLYRFSRGILDTPDKRVNIILRNQLDQFIVCPYLLVWRMLGAILDETRGSVHSFSSLSLSFPLFLLSPSLFPSRESSRTRLRLENDDFLMLANHARARGLVLLLSLGVSLRETLLHLWMTGKRIERYFMNCLYAMRK